MARIAIIGGGISGLAAAQRLLQCAAGAQLVLLEASDRLGGLLETTSRDGFLVEAAADSFLTDPPTAVALCSEVGLQQHLLSINPQARGALVVHRGQLQPIPEGFAVMAPTRIWPVVSSPLLSWRGKLRMGLELLVPRRNDDDDESLASFVRRRFGTETYERIVQPLVGGIYTADPEQLSLDATMPRFRQMERQSRSLIRATFIRKPPQKGNGPEPRFGRFAAPQRGMSSLVDAIAGHLPPESIRLDSPVDSLRPTGDGRWLLAIGGRHPNLLQVDGLIVATPAYRAARLLATIDRDASAQLRQVQYTSCAIVYLGYRRAQVAHPLNALGFVVPLIEQRTILSCSFSSVKFAGRAPGGCVLLRVFIGGACQSGLLRLPADSLIQLAEREVADLLGVRGEPVLRSLRQRHRAMPQYHIGHRSRMERVQRRLAQFPTLALAGSALSGAGIPQCIQSGRMAAEQIVSRLNLHRADRSPQGASV